MRIYLADTIQRDNLNHINKLGGAWHLESYYAVLIKKINILKWSIFKK